ncbi:MAG TPA: 2-phospho-L-lactate transferase [Thermoleophilaceae bacterium]|nr:2-phospho-L-lactate transferase [Thermoleophilaceae bacterium]
MVAVLAGGTGGAKLARGMLDVVGPDELAVVANTGDDVEVHGVHVSPDPDLVTYWLADVIDERGWGIAGDTWHAMEARRAGDQAPWFQLGDRDLELCRLRTDELAAGRRLTEAHAAVVEACGVRARVLPMSDQPVRTRVRTGGRWRDFQEFMIVDRAAAPIEAVDVAGAAEARPSPEVLQALAGAEAIVIGPSNPVISIGPILAVPGMRAALRESPAPVVAVSPFVAGHAVKGPTEPFMAHAGLPLGAAGVLRAYEGLLDGVVSDDRPPAAVPALVTDTLMADAEARRRVARETLEFARGLAGAGAEPLP